MTAELPVELLLHGTFVPGVLRPQIGLPADQTGRSRAVQGSQISNVIQIFTILSLSAMGLAGCLESETSNAPNTVLAPANAAPVISGSPATAVQIGEMYSFTPRASDADGDALTFFAEGLPAWAGFDQSTGELSGQPTLAHVGVYSNILISVTDGTASASLPRFSISVDQIGNLSTTLSWTAPTQNEDGTALTDLAGYRIYWGTTSGQYTHSVTVDPGITTYVVENLSAGTYEFVATAFNSAGVESRYSNPATKVLQ